MTRNRVSLSTILLFSFCVSHGRAQDPVDLHQAFVDLQSDVVVMNVSAHPDDEDGATLAYYRMKFGAKTYSVFFTRGEGGQNETGSALYEELGVIRTQETEAASTIQGAVPVFLNFPDFGYSKTATETFRKWSGRQEILRRLVYAIRKYKPDIIFTHHNTINGHGHHQVVGISLIAAFDAASDSLAFPEQLAVPGLALWQPRKLFVREFSGQGYDVSHAVTDVDSVRGESYLEIAARALRMHRSQGMERSDLARWTRGKSQYRLVRSASMFQNDTTSFLGGIVKRETEARSALRQVRIFLTTITKDLHRDSILGACSEIFHVLDTVKVRTAREARSVELTREKLGSLVRHLCGLKIAVSLSDSVVAAGGKLTCIVQPTSSVCKVMSWRFDLDGAPAWGFKPLGASRDGSTQLGELTCPINAVPTMPEVKAQYAALEGNHEVKLHIRLLLDGHPLSVTQPVNIDIAPEEDLTVSSGHIRFSRAHPRQRVGVTVRTWKKGGSRGVVRAMVPAGWNCNEATYSIQKEGGQEVVNLDIGVPENVAEGVYPITLESANASAWCEAHVFEVVVGKEVSVGIVQSYDNTLEMALRSMEVPFRILTETDLRSGSLSGFSTIIVDIRAYLVRADVAMYNTGLLDYARAGGNLVVMYQRTQEWKSEYAPLPFVVGRQRVTVEDAQVTVLRPEHPLMTKPNLIRDVDWHGWVQERAVYVPASVDERYEKLIASNDPDEPPLDSGYLVARVGSGSYIYTSYVWYRQLREMHAGAFRCFANMISYPLYR